MVTRRAVIAAVVVTALVAGLFVVGGCGPKPKAVTPPEGKVMTQAGKQPASEGGAKDAGPIKIGAIFSVTEGAAPLGEPEKMAAEMIVEKINEAGGVLGRQVQLIVKDDKTDPTEANTQAKYLINDENVCAIIGPSTTPTTIAIKALCQEAQVPLVSCAAGREITDPVASYVFAVPQTDVLAVGKIVDALKAKKVSSIASIYVDTAYGTSGNEQLQKQCAAAGIKIVASEKFGDKDTDMSAQLTKIKTAAPQVVVCWGTNPGPALVAKQMKTLGIKAPLVESHGVANKKFLELAGTAAEGAMLPAGRLIVWQSVADDHPQKKVLKEFAEAFKAKYNRDADTFAGHAYDSMQIVLNAIKSADSTDRAAVRDAIEKTKKFVGTAGTFSYSPEDHNGLTKDAFVWVTVANGNWKLVQ